MSERLIDEISFYKSFFHKGEYGNSADWPHSTNLLYRIRIKTKPGDTITQRLRHESGCWSLQCERWVKIGNAKQSSHAEIIFIEQIYHLLRCFPSVDGKMSTIRQISIDIILSNSSCFKCAEKLISLKKDLIEDEMFVFCDMRIKIANFYKHYKKENTRELIDMVRCQIQLSVFNGLCDWKAFLDNTVNLSLDIQSNIFYETWLVRQDRELVDSILLDCITLAACQWAAWGTDIKNEVLYNIQTVKSVKSSIDCLNSLRHYSSYKAIK